VCLVPRSMQRALATREAYLIGALARHHADRGVMMTTLAATVDAALAKRT